MLNTESVLRCTQKPGGQPSVKTGPHSHWVLDDRGIVANTVNKNVGKPTERIPYPECGGHKHLLFSV